MSTINDGGPAFPFAGAEGHVYNDQGMSLRAYFMAHAPAEPQEWFEPVMPEHPVPLGLDRRITLEEERQAMAWTQEQEKQRYVQWPAAWADEMIKQLGKAPT